VLLELGSCAGYVVVFRMWVRTLLGTIAFLRLRSTIDEPVGLGPERPGPRRPAALSASGTPPPDGARHR
jgi:hypothetical protein